MPPGLDGKRLLEEAAFYLIDLGDSAPKAPPESVLALLRATAQCRFGEVILLFRQPTLKSEAVLSLRMHATVKALGPYSDALMATAVSELGREGFVMRSANSPFVVGGGHVPFAWLQKQS